jgi:drug/metabolite transporter (DMT)-like permease
MIYWIYVLGLLMSIVFLAYGVCIHYKMKHLKTANINDSKYNSVIYKQLDSPRYIIIPFLGILLFGSSFFFSHHQHSKSHLSGGFLAIIVFVTIFTGVRAYFKIKGIAISDKK